MGGLGNRAMIAYGLAKDSDPQPEAVYIILTERDIDKLKTMQPCDIENETCKKMFNGIRVTLGYATTDNHAMNMLKDHMEQNNTKIYDYRRKKG